MPEHIVKVFNELTAAQNGETGTIVETFSAISGSLRNDFESFLPTALIEEVQVRLAQVDELRNDLKRKMQILYRTNKSLQAVMDSKSWRLTAPLRRVYDLLTRNKK